MEEEEEEEEEEKEEEKFQSYFSRVLNIYVSFDSF